MRILVTGGMGFIGRHLVRYLREDGHLVFTQDRQHAEAMDLRYGVSVVNEVDTIIHCAALVGRAQGEQDRQRTVQDNVMASMSVARHAAARGLELVYVGTSEAYGDLGEAPAVEWQGRTEALPHNLYGLSKRWGEEVCRLYHPPTKIVRLSMPYGPGYPPGAGRMALVNFIWEAMHDRPLEVHRDSSRSWCYVEDTVRAIGMVAEGRVEIPDGWVVNIGAQLERSMERVAAMVLEIVDYSQSEIVLVDPPANQTLVKRLPTELMSAAGWQPEVSLEEGIRRTFEYLTEYRVESYA